MASALLFGTTAASGATTAGLIGIGGEFSAMAALSTVGTLFSVSSALQSGSSAMQDYAVQASWERVRAANEAAAGTQDRLKKLQELRRVQAKNFATYAARGIQLEGTPMNVAEETQKQAEDELDISRYNTNQGIDSARGQEAALRARGASAQAQASSKAIGTLFDLGTRLYDKGATF